MSENASSSNTLTRLSVRSHCDSNLDFLWGLILMARRIVVLHFNINLYPMPGLTGLLGKMEAEQT